MSGRREYNQFDSSKCVDPGEIEIQNDIVWSNAQQDGNKLALTVMLTFSSSSTLDVDDDELTILRLF